MKSIFFLTVCCLIVSNHCLGQVVGHSSSNIKAVVKEEQEVDNPEIDRVVSVVNTVETKNNFIDRLNPDSNVSLPFGIIKQIGAVRYIIAIDSMKFRPEGAYFSAFASIDFPGTTKKLAFRGSHIKFNPKGVVGGDQAKLYLASDHFIRINETVSLKLLGNGQNWVEWNCNGFKAINLTGNFVFRKGKLLPDPSQTSDSVVTASFQIYTENIHNFITSINITPFKITGLEDWAFKVTNAIVDMSELSNAPSMVFPIGYSNPNNVTPQMWTGFALQSLQVKLPGEISKTGKRTEISANNLLIDNMGITGLFRVNNLFNSNEGNMGGWDFSINELGIGFICNQLTSGHLKGTVNIPVMDSTESLQYTADLNYDPDTKDVAYNFVINPVTDARFGVFSANVTLNKSSRISVTKGKGYFKPVANLSGIISFDSPNFDSNGGALAFQNLEITTEAPYITNGIFSLHNINGGQIKTSYYPVSVDDITFGINDGAPILGFNVKLNLSEWVNNSLTVATSILIKGKIEKREQFYPDETNVGKTITNKAGITVIKTKWGFDKVILNGVHVDIETSPFTLKGNISFNDKDPLYGTGFFGMLDLSIKKVIDEPIGINVGFGGKDNYRYFFLDAKIPAEYIIPSTPVGLSRIIGGIYYHMRPSKTTETELITLNQNFNSINGNALSYVPDKSIAIGLKMGVTADFFLNESVCNGEFLLDVNFSTSGGLGPVNFAGNVYSMATIKNKVNAPIKGRMVMTFDPQTKTFDALAQVNMSVFQIINGSGAFKVHFDPKIWYVCFGKPSAPNNIKILNLVEAPSYFMTGNAIEPALQAPASVSATRNESDLQNGRGFCAGARIKSNLKQEFDLGLFNVSGYYDFDLGCDLMMINYGEKATCAGSATKIGLNGRLIQGDMFLHLKGGVSINGHLKWPNDCPKDVEVCLDCCGCCCKVRVGCIVDENFSYNVFDTEVNAIIYAQVPKPLYFKGSLDCHYNILGRITGSFPFDFSYGENCTPITN